MRARIPARAVAAAALFFPLMAGVLQAAPPVRKPIELSLPAQVGKQMFFDTSLSGSGKLACSSCHDPDHAYGPPNDLAVQPGGKNMKLSGTRAVPSLRYQEYTPAYSDLMENADGVGPAAPGGGYTADGHAATLAEQSKIPLLSRNEMANRNEKAVVKKLEASAYAELFRKAFGEKIFSKPADAFGKATQALQAFQIEDISFHPYSSKYDLYATNKKGGRLTPQEKRGFDVYNDPERGNCVACHYNGAGVNGSVRLFTDFTYAAIGVPRNDEIPANRKSKYYDLGICSRTDHPLPDSAQYCGLFKVPTLRNVATRKVFFHNGRFKSLSEVLRFYNTRDTNPELWYPVVEGKAQKFDDLPEKYRANIDPQPPLDGRAPGSKPPMSDQDLADLEVFLNTLTDGYQQQLQATNVTDVGQLGTALEKHLTQTGDLCLGKFDWPVVVTANDRRGGNAVQMPVLEKLGLVKGENIEVQAAGDGAAAAVPAVRYSLTDEGRRYYIPRDLTRKLSSGRDDVHHADLCAAKLHVDQVVSREPAGDIGENQRVTLTYTYKLDPVAWARDPDVLKVFPMVSRMIDGQRSMQLTQAFVARGGEWVALSPFE
jgi:cytochrome c peroxidase